MSKFVHSLVVFCFIFIVAQATAFQSIALEKPQIDVGVENKIGDQIDLTIQFYNHLGEKKSLKELILPDRPAILVPVYYQCPRLCGLLLSGVSQLLTTLELELGKDYSVITVSFNDKEGTDLARKRREEYTNLLKKEIKLSATQPLDSWHFLAGDLSAINSLMRQIGFNFKPDSEEFVHTAVLILLTPDGKIARYVSGVKFTPWDVKLGLIEASQGKVGTWFDQAFLTCFRYDHIKGKYVWFIDNVLKLGGALTLLLVMGVVYFSLKVRK
ncbi:MAG TPA: hypothetical protein PKD37_02905 [Oligoflexia bacterium]|nr:hypothetical protein [Oligoflexia bacterium]HMP26916.1 hypothetical protein [Oligoflexia bacterium]